MHATPANTMGHDVIELDVSRLRPSPTRRNRLAPPPRRVWPRALASPCPCPFLASHPCSSSSPLPASLRPPRPPRPPRSSSSSYPSSRPKHLRLPFGPTRSFSYSSSPCGP